MTVLTLAFRDAFVAGPRFAAASRASAAFDFRTCFLVTCGGVLTVVDISVL